MLLMIDLCSFTILIVILSFIAMLCFKNFL